MHFQNKPISEQMVRFQTERCRLLIKMDFPFNHCFNKGLVSKLLLEKSQSQLQNAGDDAIICMARLNIRLNNKLGDIGSCKL